MAIKTRGPDHVIAFVNVPMPRELAVQVKDAGGRPVKDNWVTFTATPPDSFEFAGGQLYAAVKTDERGIASVRGTPRVTRQLRVNAEAADGLDTAHFIIDVREEDGTMVQQAGGDVIVIDGGGTRPTTHIPMWPIAAMVIAAMVLGSALWLFGGRGNSSGPTQPPIVIHQGGGGGSTVDPTARADAAAARAGVEAAKQELGLALETGLAENAAHDQEYAREFTRPTLRQALATARQVREHLTGRAGDQKPAICDDDPNLPACRE